LEKRQGSPDGTPSFVSLPGGQMPDRPKHVILDGTDRDLVLVRDVLALHVLDTTENENVADPLRRFEQDCGCPSKPFPAQEGAFWREIHMP
jgi:hypothetical protein